ncbi:carboxylesterase family protein [Streptomyces yaizuensis]|uniref:Carboxylic ester hydrolase n=1 Tax=Streptomyces yaizuensis TaxID=2989713 RepID=A0ABQ5NXU9_9ACTN|nr:carboxylesterase family protein [Streptomyces sp. YSPA8]GLF95192.1 carboxylesterase family protein [Streptomyces sp. YSPA8]
MRTDTGPALARPESGPVTGLRGADRLLRFPGIRYGTAARFAPPVRPARHTGTVDATRPGPICPQLPSPLEPVFGPQRNEPPHSEDCLYLAVTTPGLTGNRPVMVWLPGGGFLTGGGTLPMYDGGRLAADGDVVVVSVNYRLGALGYLVHQGVSDGNLGLYDQILALEWVHDNIAAFGGDPANITVFGQSAGAASALMLLSVPRSRRLIRRVIAQSAPTRATLPTRDEAYAAGVHFAEAARGDLRTLPVRRILEAQARTAQGTAGMPSRPRTVPLRPVLTEPLGEPAAYRQTFRSAPMPDLLIGYTSNEGGAFARCAPSPLPGEAVAAISHRVFVEPAHETGRQVLDAGGAAFLYEFARPPAEGGLGAVHGAELPFLLGTEEAWAQSPLLDGTDWATVDARGRSLRQSWAHFARYGSPGTTEAAWPQWTGDGTSVRRITW